MRKLPVKVRICLDDWELGESGQLPLIGSLVKFSEEKLPSGLIKLDKEFLYNGKMFSHFIVNNRHEGVNVMDVLNGETICIAAFASTDKHALSDGWFKDLMPYNKEVSYFIGDFRLLE